jgi:hypothetical protein
MTKCAACVFHTTDVCVFVAALASSHWMLVTNFCFRAIAETSALRLRSLLRVAMLTYGNKKEFQMLRKTILTLAATAALGMAALAPTAASADGGYGYGGYGWYGGYGKGYHYSHYPFYYGHKYYHRPWFAYGPRYFHRGFKYGGWKYGHRRYW